MGINTLTTEKGKEKVILVGVAAGSTTSREANEHLDELERLTQTAGGEVCEKIIQRREKLNPSTLIGGGKVQEVARLVKSNQADLVIFDDDLSGSQAKNLEKQIPVKIIDRSGIILDIFARHATTRESKIQVEVAQLQYMLPRLTKAWTHLCRQVGGIGTRGPGETQLEVDRRQVRKRISDLSKKLEKIESIRDAQHNHRVPTFHAALVGYTNAGKSTLMNALTNAKVKAEDTLFATLDPTTRKVFLGPGEMAVLSDTVGFIRKLPVGLVASFKSTLSVVRQAGLILHIIDASSREFEEQMQITGKVLKEMETEELPRLTVFNKVDLLGSEKQSFLKEQFGDAIFVSAEQKTGLEALKESMRWHLRMHKRSFPGYFNTGYTHHSNLNDSDDQSWSSTK